MVLLAALTLFSVAPAQGIAGEPNDTAATATGPLKVGLTYPAVLETTNDQDVYFFYVPLAYGQVMVSLNNLSGYTEEEEAANCSRIIGGEIYNEHKEELENGVTAEPGQVETLAVSVPAPGKYYLRITHGGCLLLPEAEPEPNLRYSFVVTGNVTGYGPIARACKVARHKVSQARRRFRQARHRLQRSSRSGRVGAHEAAHKATRELRKTERTATKRCSISR